MVPALPLPSATEGTPVPGLLVVRTHYGDDAAWNDVRSRLGDLPGVHPPGPHPVGEREAAILAKNPKHLIVVDDPAWDGAGPDSVRAAVAGSGAWFPLLILIADGQTMADAHLRPLMGLHVCEDGGQDERTDVRIGPRAVATTHLLSQVLAEPLATYATYVSLGAEPVVGASMELSAHPPRYTAPHPDLALLPHTEDALIVRTDHTDDDAWEALVAAVRAPVPDGGSYENEEDAEFFHAYVDVLDDPRYAGATMEQLLSLVPPDYSHSFLMVADRTALGDPRFPLLVVDLHETPGLSFRAAPAAIQAIENNLSISNMDFSDFYLDEGEIDLGDSAEEITEEQRRL